MGFGLVNGSTAHLQLGITSNYNVAQTTTIHTSLPRFLQPPLVVAWLQSSNKDCSSRTAQEVQSLTADSRLYCSLHGQSQSHITTDGQSVILGVKPQLGPKNRFLLLSDSCGFVDVEPPSLMGGRV
jgi:hypothetical protein